MASKALISPVLLRSQTMFNWTKSKKPMEKNWFSFTAAKWSKGEMDIAEFESHAVPPFTQMIKRNEKLNELSKTMTFFYEFKDKNGEIITIIKIPPGDISEE